MGQFGTIFDDKFDDKKVKLIRAHPQIYIEHKLSFQCRN